jgi:hypothetical protein
MRTNLLLALLGGPLLAACVDYDLNNKDTDRPAADDSGPVGDTDPAGDGACPLVDHPPEAVAPNDSCDYAVGGFEPIVEWDIPGKSSTALPVVADLDGDGLPEIVVVWSTFTSGSLGVYHGDGTEMWTDRTNIGYGSAPAVADLDGDGSPEVLAVVDFGNLSYGLGAWSATGTPLWQSDPYTDGEFNWATAPVISDMDHDGSPEIVCGRVIFNADGTERAEGRGTSVGASAGFGSLREGAHPAVADLDLDGVEEVITGDAIYSIDGTVLHRNSAGDGAVAVANLDGDPEGEYVATSGNTIRALDTDASVIWGPITNSGANILSVPSIADIDGDGEPEILVAGGNELWALNEDGSTLWTARVHDESGATGASIFDFDADGIPEVVYIDELAMAAYNGADGVMKFQSNDHRSNTMYDYPVIADLDGDGHAEILVAHEGYSSGLSAYRDATNSWAPARAVWNQHAYTITNINDDLSVPVDPIPNFTLYNNYHSDMATIDGEALSDELEAEILDICEDDCDAGTLRVVGRGKNTGNGELAAGISLALYGTPGNVLLGTATTTAATPALMTTESVEFVVDTALLDGVTGLLLKVDDDGTGTGAISECVETNNGWSEDGGWCE